MAATTPSEPLHSTMFVTYERHLPLVPDLDADRHPRGGAGGIDLAVAVVPDAATVFSTMLEMFDLADALCRAESLLSVARTPAQRAFQTWHVGEIINQLRERHPRR